MFTLSFLTSPLLLITSRFFVENQEHSCLMIPIKQRSGCQQFLNFMYVTINSDIHTKDPKGLFSPPLQYIWTTWDAPQESGMCIGGHSPKQKWTYWVTAFSCGGRVDCSVEAEELKRLKDMNSSQVCCCLNSANSSLFSTIWFLSLSFSYPHFTALSGSCS